MLLSSTSCIVAHAAGPTTAPLPEVVAGPFLNCSPCFCHLKAPLDGACSPGLLCQSQFVIFEAEALTCRSEVKSTCSCGIFKLVPCCYFHCYHIFGCTAKVAGRLCLSESL